jgi:hypothetical protein
MAVGKVAGSQGSACNLQTDIPDEIWKELRPNLRTKGLFGGNWLSRVCLTKDSMVVRIETTTDTIPKNISREAKSNDLEVTLLNDRGGSYFELLFAPGHALKPENMKKVLNTANDIYELLYRREDGQ